MSTGPLPRTAAVAEATFFGNFSGQAWMGLVAAALVYPLLVVAIASAHRSDVDLLGTSEELFSALFLPVVLLLLCLVNGVGLFRTEREEDTLLYLLNRTVPRPSVIVGKYLGFAGATLFVLLPSTIVGTALASVWTGGPTAATPGVLEAVVALTTLGTLAYGAFFLALGLLTRQALVVGLLYGFLWETFISLLPGPVRELTVVYYLRGIGARLAVVGPLGGGPSEVTLVGGIAGLLVAAVAALGIAAVYLRVAETGAG